MSTDALGPDASLTSVESPKPASTWYSPLPHDGDSFRLLRVLPSWETSSPLRCELYTTSISREENQYIAGSYVWGQPEPTETILLDGTSFKVRRNLFHFLRVFRSRYQSQVIWIDAICINQEDTQERGHQVQEMKRIYSGAKCVYCWLGCDKPFPHASILDQRRMVDMYYWFKGDERQHTRQKNQFEFIVQAEYWSRMWVVQEFILAKKILLMVGTNRISYSQLHSIAHCRRFFKESSIISRSKTVAFMNGRAPRRGRFESLFEGFGMLSCSVPQDGVFALLGLVGARKEELELVRMIDYNITVWQLLQQILDSNVLERSPFRFTEQYNRFVVKGQEDRYMCGPVHVKLGQNQQWELCGPDDSRYASVDGTSLHMAMAMRASPGMTYTQPTDTHVIEISMYTPEWRATTEQSGVSVHLYTGSYSLSQRLQHYSICVLIKGCDSLCTATCATHAILGFSWKLHYNYERATGPAPTIPIDVSLLTHTASSNLAELIYTIQQESARMVEAASNKVRVGVTAHHSYYGSLPQYGLDTDLETMVKLSTFALDMETSKAWRRFLEWIMEQLQIPGFGADAANRWPK